MRTRHWLPFAVCVALALAAGGLGSFFTLPAIDTWYAGLSKPGWTPPSWVFAPVWNTLYLLMGIAAGLVWRSALLGRSWALALFVLQLAVNVAWSYCFFGLHDPTAALFVIKVLWLLIVAMMAVFWQYSRVAVLLLLPYLLWVTYASTLNLGIILLNP